MKQKIIRNILENSTLDEENKRRLQQVLMLTEETLALREEIPEDRWLAMGHHLAEAINRTIRGELLAPIDEDTMLQIEKIYIEKGYQILYSLAEVGKNIYSTSEVALFAIHLQCAAYGF